MRLGGLELMESGFFENSFALLYFDVFLSYWDWALSLSTGTYRVSLFIRVFPFLYLKLD